MVLLGRSLGAEGYGNYSFWYALIPLISNLAGAGIGIVVTREVARDPENAPRLIGDAILVRLVLGALVLLGVGLLSPVLYGPGHLVLVLVVTGAACSTSARTSRSGCCAGTSGSISRRGSSSSARSCGSPSSPRRFGPHAGLTA
jgi:O-antigen/teichoic acid export membrane protein